MTETMEYMTTHPWDGRPYRFKGEEMRPSRQLIGQYLGTAARKIIPEDKYDRYEQEIARAELNAGYGGSYVTPEHFMRVTKEFFDKEL